MKVLLLEYSIFTVAKRVPLFKLSTGLLTLNLAGAIGLTRDPVGLPILLPELIANADAEFVVKYVQLFYFAANPTSL